MRSLRSFGGKFVLKGGVVGGIKYDVFDKVERKNREKDSNI